MSSMPINVPIHDSTAWIEQELQNLKAQNLFRSLPDISADLCQQQAGGHCIDFFSNDYLGLAHNIKVKKKVLLDLQNISYWGATGSRLISGNTSLIQDVENYLAQVWQIPFCLLFGSGYLANLGVLSAFRGLKVEFFSDELNHASLIDGCRLNRSPVHVFKHNNCQHLEELLKEAVKKSIHPVIVTESVFSMDGDLAPVADIIYLAKKYGAIVVLDEAHATGVCGVKGLGLGFGIDYENLITVHTCSKALGVYGAFVGCHQIWRDFFINRARSFIYTTSLPAPVLLQIKYAVEELLAGDLVQRLQHNISCWNKYLKTLNCNGPLATTAVWPWIVGDSAAAMNLEKECLKNHIFIKAIRYPTVPEGHARLRFTLKAFHQDWEFKKTLDVLKQLGDL